MREFRFKKQRASGLLLSFFLGSILISLVLTVSFLVTRDIQTVRSLVSGAQSRYAAEGMNELGLQIVNENLPGYEPQIDQALFSVPVLASLDITAIEDAVPCSNREEEWRKLDVTESMQLALFAQVDEHGGTENVEKFYVEFYVADEEGNVTFPPSDDVLRWKILGLNEAGQTEAISEFIPLLTNRVEQSNPSLFGSWIEDGTVPSGYSSAKFRQNGTPAVFHPDYPIETFLETHEYNYLVLTNVITRSLENNIYFRVLGGDHPENPVGLSCEYVTLTANVRGENGALYTQQSVETLIKEGENLPAFDFVFYNTDNTGEEAETVPGGSALPEVGSGVTEVPLTTVPF